MLIEIRKNRKNWLDNGICYDVMSYDTRTIDQVMILNLDPVSPVPIYLQIVDQVRRLIALGALRPGERIPSVRELAARCRINRNTAARAIQELERAGVVRTQVGQGTFVAEEPPPADPSEDAQAVDAQ